MDAVALEGLVLRRLEDEGPISDSGAFALALGVDHGQLLGVVQSLWTDEYVTMEASSRSWLVPTPEGEAIRQGGSPEFHVYEAVLKAGSLTLAEIEAAVGKAKAKVGVGAAMREKWLKKDGAAMTVAKRDVTDAVRELLEAVVGGTDVATQQQMSGGFVDADAEKQLTRRKLVKKEKATYYSVGRGPHFKRERKKKVGDLTVEALKDGSWKTAEFKAYNFNAMGVDVGGGYAQPLLKVRAEFRRILMGMGFEEMPTNRWVESSFWNFDALFQPQSHPARDAHDTFFVKSPRDALTWPEDYYAKVKDMHERGGDIGSLGHRCVFDDAEARKNLLRTHTTAVSARVLRQLAENTRDGKPFTPAKYFSIDRVFRNETMDSTHLCEFHQVEGLVADYDLSLGNLISTIRTFFANIGITQLRFKPAFNPYTEPSMEVFGYHPDLKKWTEIGNSGMFRPEMLAPMGLPPNVRVIAWGLSLERPTMIKYRISNIRDLFGHKADLTRTKQAPMCLF
mmetsp:Transcript_20030/g.64507  ORF Transcript_20030/g.64507 Transcript_20030/m.64507 type:complete len:508 (+) Transcript_20030:74-1597(+)